MDSSDQYHKKAKRSWNTLLTKETMLISNNYIVLETGALVQNRLGFQATALLYKDILAVVDILWVEEATHQMAYELWLSLGRRNLSLVDCVSFVTMRSGQIETIFGYDRHFEEQGFVPVEGK